MASLSNINGKFAVDSTGAIKFNNLTGTNNQVLIANTGASPTWVDVSTIIGGPYLPLTGGTLAGDGNLVVGGTLTVNGVSTLNSNDLMGNTVVNPASGFADQTGIGLKYSATVPEIQVSSDSTAMQLGRTSTGGDGQIMALRYASNTIHSFNTNSFSVGTNATFSGTLQSGNFAIGAAPSSFGSGVPTITLQGTAANSRGGAIVFKEQDGTVTTNIYSTDGSDGYGTVINAAQGSFRVSVGALAANKLEINSSGNATFAGGVTGSYYTATNFINVQVDDAEVYWTNTANNDYWVWKRDASNNFILDHYNGSATSNALTFNSSQNATFAGNIYSGLNGMMEFRSSSYNNRQIGIDSQGFYVFNPNAPSGGRYDLKINDSGNTTFAGTGTFTDAVTVNGTYPGLTLNSTSYTRFAITNRYSTNYVTFDMTPQGGSTLEALTLKNNGNLGIGTNLPDAKLEVKAADTASTTDYATKVIKAVAPLVGGYTGTKIISLLGGFDGAIHAVDFGYGYNTTGYDMMLSTNDNTSGNPIERMRIDSSGNVIVSNGGLFLNKSDGAYVALKHNNSLKGYLGIANQVITGGTTGDIGLTATSNLVLGSGGTTERIRITSTGQLQLQGSSSSLAKSTTQTEWAYIPGSTPGASLMLENPSGMSSASAGYHIVYGANNSSPYQAFIDVITYQCGSSTNVTVISSTTLNNSPGSRSYSKNSTAVFLNISGFADYNCNIKTTFINYPH